MIKIEVHEVPLDYDGRFMTEKGSNSDTCVGCLHHERDHEWVCTNGHVIHQDAQGLPKPPFPCGQRICGHQAWLCCPRPN